MCLCVLFFSDMYCRKVATVQYCTEIVSSLCIATDQLIQHSVECKSQKQLAEVNHSFDS